jgi:hypothetical protein
VWLKEGMVGSIVCLNHKEWGTYCILGHYEHLGRMRWRRKLIFESGKRKVFRGHKKEDVTKINRPENQGFPG